MVVLTIALVVPNPMAPAAWPAAIQLRLGNFDFFYVFIGLAVLAVAVWRSRRLALRQAVLARERANLARYFAPGRAKQLARSAEPIGAVRQQAVAVLFADIVGFTRLCEGLPPADVMALRRDFHRRMAEAVFAHDGTLEKYIGDALMATFGTPRASTTDARDAIACSQARLATIAAWNAERAARGVPPIRIGIGLHHGEVVLGDIGDARCREFAVLGDTVNVANHLETLCRELQADIVASEDLVARARRPLSGFLATFAPAPPQLFKGRREPLSILTYRASPSPGCST